MQMENIDKLTGLYTQKYFEKRLDEELRRCKRYRRPITVILVEINYSYFEKEHNIRWAMIYTILKQFGALLLKQLRNVDIAGRYGGELFALVLPETSVEGGMIAGERLCQVVAEHKFMGDNINKNDVRIAVNAGLATSPVHGLTAQEIISSAQQAMLMARNQGGNMVIKCPNDLYSDEYKSLAYLEGDQDNPEDEISEDIPEESKAPEDNSHDTLKEAIEKKADEIKKNVEEKIQAQKD